MPSRFLLHFVPVSARKQKLQSHKTLFMNMYISTNDVLLKYFIHETIQNTKSLLSMNNIEICLTTA